MSEKPETQDAGTTAEPISPDQDRHGEHHERTRNDIQSDVMPDNPPFTSLTRTQLRRLRLLLGVTTITSPLTATIYFPLLPLLRQQFTVTAQAINLTLTVYIIFQAISPVIFGPFSDAYGRRPLFLFTLALYVVGNIGLAINEHSYPVLLILRAVQSLGASAAYAISFGVVADTCLPSERGRMLGPISMALNLGACVGPIIGGVVAYANGDHVWVFWSLVIIGVALFTAVGSLLPETSRRLVGNGSERKLLSIWQLSWLGLLSELRNGKARATESDSSIQSEIQASRAQPSADVVPARTVLARNMYTCFRMIFFKDSCLSLWVHGSFYTVDYSYVAALPDIFRDIYGYNEWQLGLAYLPRGVGIIAGSFFTGRLMDRNFRATVGQLGWTADEARGHHSPDFPIERARSRGSYWMLLISTTSTIGYGWAIQMRAHPAILLMLQFLQGFWGTFFYTTYSTLLVDTFPNSPSTAAASTSVTRCAMAAAGVAVLDPLLGAAGRGWYFTILGIWSGLFALAAIVLLRMKGMEWRKARSGSI